MESEDFEILLFSYVMDSEEVQVVNLARERDTEGDSCSTDKRTLLCGRAIGSTMS